MMQTREATDRDIPQIIGLLKESLGESLMPKSESYWSWKHKENPFGDSPVLVSTDQDMIVGVRAFMQWKWRDKDRTFRALRAVDTATHPQYQGKGIFKKLSLSLVETCRNDGYDFIFNTPNSQSKPGYLKMGWNEVGQLPLAVSLQRPLKMAANVLGLSRTTFSITEDDSVARWLKHPGLEALIRHQQLQTRMSTDLSVRYLEWRYLSVPVAKYVAIGEEEGGKLTGLVFCRIKDSKFGRELRIVDALADTNLNYNKLRKQLADTKRRNGIDYTTISGVADAKNHQLAGRLNMTVTMGPIVTVRPLQFTGGINDFSAWSPTLGDLELF